MSAFYLDILKDRLYTSATHSLARRSAQTALWHILDTITRLMAPILPFTAEEVYQSMHQGRRPGSHAESVHTLLFPEYKPAHDREELLREWDQLMQIREVVSKSLEEVRQTRAIGNSLDAQVTVASGTDTAALLRRHAEDLRYIFIVSQVHVEESGGNDAPLRSSVSPAEGEKCERCWNYSVRVGSDPDLPTLCERCLPVVRETA